MVLHTLNEASKRDFIKPTDDAADTSIIILPPPHTKHLSLLPQILPAPCAMDFSPPFLIPTCLPSRDEWTDWDGPIDQGKGTLDQNWEAGTRDSTRGTMAVLSDASEDAGNTSESGEMVQIKAGGIPEAALARQESMGWEAGSRLSSCKRCINCGKMNKVLENGMKSSIIFIFYLIPLLLVWCGKIERNAKANPNAADQSPLDHDAESAIHQRSKASPNLSRARECECEWDGFKE